MFLDLAHTKKPVYEASRHLVLECHRVTNDFPVEERFAMVQQLRRAALSAHLNTADGCSRKSEAERKRFFEIARGSVVEVNAAIGIAYDLDYKTADQLHSLGERIVSTFKQLTGLMG